MPTPGQRSRFVELFGLDLRSLALFRIALGALLLVDLATRLPTLEIVASERGVLPLALVERPSLHALSGSLGFELALVGAAAVFASLLLVGLATRVAALGCWLLLASLLYRNPYVTDGGDVFASKLLLWSVFLPLGARASLDARRAPERSDAGPFVLSAATLGLLADFVYLYVGAAFVKSGPEWRWSGGAIEQVLGQSYWLRPAGERLAAHPALVRLLTPVVPLYEAVAPLLLFVPARRGALRCGVILSFWLFQLSLGLCIQLNLFPFFASVATLALLPGRLWDRLGFAESGTRIRREPAWRDACAGLALAGLALGVARVGPLPRPLAQALDWAELSHRWTMYATPPRQDFRFALRGTLADGAAPSLLETPGTAAWERARAAHASYRLKYFLQKAMSRAPLLDTYAAFVCRAWNEGSEPARRLLEVRVFADLWAIHPRAEPRHHLLVHFACP